MTSCENLAKIIIFVQQKCAPCRFFMGVPKDLSRCGNEGFKLLVLQVVLKKENFNQ